MNVSEVLVEHGANINPQDFDGWTALHYASFKNNLDVARYLIEKGAEISTKSNSGYTPRDLALFNSNFQNIYFQKKVFST